MSKDRKFNSVWDAIEKTPQQAASMRARSELMMALQEWVKAAGKRLRLWMNDYDCLTQSEARYLERSEVEWLRQDKVRAIKLLKGSLQAA